MSTAVATPDALVEKVLPVLREHAGEVDRQARFPVESLTALRESGLMGLLVPWKYGGLDGNLGDLVRVATALAAGCSSTAMIWAMHCQQVDTVVRFAHPRLKESLLPRLAAGEVYIASVTSEKGKGGHVLSASAPLHITESGLLRIERPAPFVTGGRNADGFLITMRRGPDAPQHDVSLVYADRDQLDVHAKGEWDALGMRGTDTLPLHLEGEVPATQLIGEPGDFRAAAVDSFIPAGHLGWAGCWLGAAKAALADVVALARSPRRPASLDVPASDLVAERLARVRMTLELVSAYLHRVSEEVDDRRERGESLDVPAIHIHLNTVKVMGSELTFDAVENLIRLAGMGLGYLAASPIPLERHLRDLQSASLNNANDRLLTATGMLALTDRAVRLA